MPTEPFVFHGSLVDGPLLDVVELAGLELTDDEQDRLWDRTTARDLLLQCPCVEEIDHGECDNGPGTSDAFYRYEATSEWQLGEELRVEILKVLAKGQEAEAALARKERQGGGT